MWPHRLQAAGAQFGDGLDHRARDRRTPQSIATWPCRISQPAISSAFASAGFLPWVDVGSGLPPSAQTRLSIISFSGLGLWYQYTGVTMITACAAAHRS